MPPNNELPVLPMTAIDEITYRTPDALFNGSAVVNVVQSCIPNIRNAWKMPGSDLNAILIAIRIASYGANMDVETTCTSCGHTDDYTVSLNSILDSMPKSNFAESVKQGDLEIYFKPVDYETQNQINLLQFEQQRILQQIQDVDQPEDQKMKILNNALHEITKLTVRAINSSISGIRTPAALVSNQQHIEEFLNNCDRALFVKIRDHAIKLKTDSELPPLKLTCSECNHQYEQAMIMDSTNFFGAAS
jgi:RNase P subunit RPR2